MLIPKFFLSLTPADSLPPLVLALLIRLMGLRACITMAYFCRHIPEPILTSATGSGGQCVTIFEWLLPNGSGFSNVPLRHLMERIG